MSNWPQSKEIHPNKALNNFKLYFKWRVQRAQEYVDWSKKFIDIKGKKVLDLGCGYGSLTCTLAREKAQVFAIDISQKSLKIAKKFTQKFPVNISQAANEKLPFKNNEFDIIFSFCVIEHVHDYQKSIKEIFRCLKPKGYLVLEMTPYYSLISGHHLYNYTLIPVQYLPKKLIKRLIFSKKLYKVRSPQDAWETFITLNKISIKRLKKELRKYQLQILNENYIFKIPKLVKLNINWIKRIPLLNELFPVSYQVLLKKVK